MRSLQKNNQKMFYASLLGQREKYETDDNDKIVYTEVDGELIPVGLGEFVNEYGLPIEFHANINGKLHEIIIQSFGVDQSPNYCQIVCAKNKLKDLQVGALIWRESEIEYKDNNHLIVKESSADYVVRGVLNEGLNEDMYFLRKLSKEDDSVEND